MSAHDNQDYQNLWDASGSDNTLFDLDSGTDSGSDNTQRPSRRRRSLPEHLEVVHADYVTALTRAPLAGETPRIYASQIRGFLAWLADADLPGDPLADARFRDGAVRDYRGYLQTVLRRRPASINLALAAVSDFFVRSGLGAPNAARLDLPQAAPRAFTGAENVRWLRVVEQQSSARDRVLAYLGRYAGLRISERVGLDVRDVALSARKAVITVHSGKGGKFREIPAHPVLHQALMVWVYEERPGWPGAGASDALLLNARGARLGTRGADKILGRIAEQAGIEDYSTHVDRHSFATELLRERGADIVLVAALLGHARLEETRRYTLPSFDEKAAAVAGLAIDR
jgi:integrase/recombinase XerC